jgi:hypothetical protein
MYNDGFDHDFLHSVTYLYGVDVKGNNNDRQNVSALFVEIILSLLLLLSLSRGFLFVVILFHIVQKVFLIEPPIKLIRYLYFFKFSR